MQSTYYKSLVYIAFALTIFSLYCALNIGLSSDENGHHIIGGLRYYYLKSLGKSDGYDFQNTKYFPGLYDTIHYFFYQLANVFIDIKHIVKIKHFINFSFSSLGLLGLFFVNRKIFNKEVAILSCILTLLNPFFFGHIGMNPKDPIIFFALIWSIYFFINYLENLERPRVKQLVLMSFFIGFGAGTRLSFVTILLPLALVWIFVIFKKKIKAINAVYDLLLGLIIIFFLTIITWPHIHNGGYELILEVIKKSSTWLIAFKHGIINGEFYDIQNTPRTYILDVFLYRMPIYSSILIIFSYLILLLKKKFFIEKLNSNYLISFYLLNVVLFFPITIIIITKTNLYDNVRLILFVIPFFSTIASIGLFFILMNFKEFNFLYKSFSYIVFFLLILSFYRFASLTPYQYVYINYLSTPIFSKAQNKFEHDYWFATYGELITKIKKKYGEVESAKLKIRTCDTYKFSHRFYFDNIIKTTQADPENAEYVIMSNRNLRFRKMNCFQLFKGEDIVSVKRLGLTLSTFRKIQSEEAREYLTKEWIRNEFRRDLFGN